MSKADILRNLRRRKEEALGRIDDFVGPEMHTEERIARGIIDDIFTQAEQYVEWAIMPDGRPMFQHMLSDKELLDYWLNPLKRPALEQQVYTQQGTEGLGRMITRAGEIYDKWLQGQMQPEVTA